MYWITGIPCPQCGGFFKHNPSNHELITKIFGEKRSNDLGGNWGFGLIKVCARKKLINRNPRQYQMIRYYGCINGHRYSPGMLQILLDEADKNHTLVKLFRIIQEPPLDKLH